ncbi:fatty acyl-CoA hydrolase precursor, medium chain-like isoform X3 [Branchiostoma floridae x Branchiostoma japonicum]
MAGMYCASRGLCVFLVCTAVILSLTSGSDAAVVTTTHGDVSGSEFLTSSVVGNAVFDRVFTFKGIPYAAPPVAHLRWRPPQDHTGWTGVRDVTEFGSRCPQVEFDLSQYNLTGTILDAFPFRSNSSSEDCLFLNVYTPNVSDTANLPVMVWIHGGGWNSGSADTYPAEIPTSLHNVVMVTLNYRLGNLGFMQTLDDDAPGNFGLLDQIKALEWVRGNIRNFGGDPDKVTIFGESAGGWSVSMLVMSPMATGLFHRAISQSGVAGVPVVQKGDITLTQLLAHSLNCSTDSYEDMMSCLYWLPSEYLLTLLYPPVVIDGRFLLQSPWDLMNNKVINRVDYLLGSNNDEFATLASEVPYVDADGLTRAEFETYLPYHLQHTVDQYLGGSIDTILQPVIDQYLDPDMADDPIYLRDQFLQLQTDAWFAAPTVMMAQAQSGMPAVAWQASSRVYQYELQHRASVFSFFRPAFVTGADHADDLYFVFGIPLLRDDTGTSWKYSYTQEERDLSLDMMAYWVNFATNGDPNDFTGAARMRTLVTWPRYMTSSQSYLKLNMASSADVRLRESNMKFWNEEVPRLMGKDLNTGSGGIRETSCILSVLAFTFVVSYLMA